MASAGDLKQRSEKLLAELTKLHVGGDPKETLGWKFLELAAGSYEGKHIRFALNKIAASGSDEVFGRESPGLLEVSFRGTLGLRHRDQWISGKGNATAALVKPDSPLQGAVHAGFWSGYGGVRKQVLDWVEGHARKDTSLVIRVSGHSRGAAFATLAAPDLARRFPGSRVELVTWAPPRVGDSAFGSFCGELANLSIVAFANKADPVAHLPPEDVKGLPQAVLTFLPEGAADSLQGFAHVVEPMILDAAFAGAVAWEALAFAAQDRTPHDIEEYQDNYALFFEDVLVACRQKKVQLCRCGFQVALGLVLQQGQATSREVQACAAELRAQGEATQRLLQDAGKRIEESLRGLESRIIDEIRRAEMQKQTRDLCAAIHALEGALARVLAAGGDTENCLRPAIQQAKLQVFGAAELAKALADDDGFEALFKSLASALCTILYAAMVSPLEPPALRGFFAEAAQMHEKLSPLIGRQARRVESSADLRERAPEFEKLARAWELLGRHEDCPSTLRSLLPDESARLLHQKDFRAAMKGWALRAEEQQAKAAELLGRLEDAQKVEAFKEATRSWAEHWERMSDARKLLADAKPVLAVGGRANAGKTTFLNAILCRWVEGAPANLLPVSHLENTSCIAELHLEMGAEPGGALARVSRKVLNSTSGSFEEDPGFSKGSFSEWKGLREALKKSVQQDFQEERQQEGRLVVTIFNAKRALLLCDTPGMDGLNNIAALKNFARTTVFMYTHLVSVVDTSLGSQTFGLFEQLHGQSCVPPVVVLTKFEQLVESTEGRLRREEASTDDASDDESPAQEDDPRKRAERTAEEDVAHLMSVLLRELPHTAGRRCLPLFAAVSETPGSKKKSGAGAGDQQLDEVLDFLGTTLQEYTELRRADAFVSFVATETNSLINVLLQSEPGLFSETDLASYRDDLVGKMECMLEEYFQGFPQDKMELYTYPTEEKKQKAWSKATHHLLPDLEAVYQATHKTWSRETYLKDMMQQLSERWQEAYCEDISAESCKVLSNFASALAKDMTERAEFEMQAPSIPTHVGFDLLVGPAGVGLGTAGVMLLDLGFGAATSLGVLGYACAGMLAIGGGIISFACVAASVMWMAEDKAGIYDSKVQADIALDQVVKVLHGKIDEIKTETKTRLGALARQVVERMAAFRDPSRSELGQAGNLDGCRDDAGEAVRASRELRMEMQAALQRMHRWVGGDARLEQIVLRSLGSDGGRELKTAKGGA